MSSSDHFKGRYSQPPVPQPQAESPPEAVKPPRPSPDSQPEPTAGFTPLSAEIARERQPMPRAAALAGLAGLVTLAVVGVNLMNRGQPEKALVWQPSCGSQAVAGTSWWPVLGPEQAVEIVRSRYCGDAYLTTEGATQVASFSSQEEAETFAERLSRESGFAFRVGQPRIP